MKINDLIQFFVSMKINPWKLISILELGLIAFLLKKIYGKKKNEEYYIDKQTRDSKQEEIDLENVIGSMFNAPTLYDKLKRKIHPDRFPNDLEKNRIASDLATQLNQHKNDLKKLNEIKTIAIEKLGLEF